MSDAPGFSPFLLLLALVVVPAGLAVLLGLVAQRGETPLVFRCLRCGRRFLRKPHLRFPTACGLCRSRDWNEPR